MAISPGVTIGGAETGGATSLASQAFTPAVNDRMLVAVSANGAIAMSSVTSVPSYTWTKLATGTLSAGNVTVTIWTAVATAASSTVVTANPASSTGMGIGGITFRGTVDISAGSGCLDVKGEGNSTSGSPTVSTSSPTSSANEGLFAAYGDNGDGVTPLVGTGYTLGGVSPTVNTVTLRSEYNVDSGTTGTKTGDWASGGSTLGSSLAVVAIKQAASGGAIALRRPHAYQLLGARTGRYVSGSSLGALQTQRIIARGWRPLPAVAAAGVVDALAGTPTGVGNVTAALSVNHNLASTTTGVGNTTAGISVQHNLATGPVGVGKTTAALSVKHNLATTTAGVGAVTAGLSVKHNLAATATGVGAITAALSEKHNLSTTATGVGATGATLSVKNNLASTTTGVGAVSPSLTSVHLDALAGTPTGVCRVTAALSLQHLLAVTVVGVANCSAGLSGGSAVLTDGTGTGWYRRQRQVVQPQRPLVAVQTKDVRLAARVQGGGLVMATLTVWSPTFTREELIAISHFVDADELAALMAI